MAVEFFTRSLSKKGAWRVVDGDGEDGGSQLPLAAKGSHGWTSGQ